MPSTSGNFKVGQLVCYESGFGGRPKYCYIQRIDADGKLWGYWLEDKGSLVKNAEERQLTYVRSMDVIVTLIEDIGYQPPLKKKYNRPAWF